MIGKKVKNAGKGASKPSRIGKLTEYVREPERENAHEKCVYAGALNFLSDDAAGQTVEMIALAQEAVRSRDPVNHYVLSWKEGEQPNRAQCDEAVGIVLKEMGLSGHQVIYALHADTDNAHLHLVVNRVHPDTLRAVEINKGFDVEALHRAVARIEHTQGWERERNGRYRVQENGELARSDDRAMNARTGEPGQERVDERVREPEARVRDMEQRTGEKSAQRVGMEQVPHIVKAARDWADLHGRLAAAGLRYEKKGSGALLYVGEQPVKASTADRNASLGKLEKRFGPYEAASGQMRIAVRQPEPLQANAMPEGFKAYAAARRGYARERSEAGLMLRQRIDAERKQLAERHQRERTEVLDGRWRGQGEALNALRSVLAAQQAGERAGMRERHRTERERLRARYGGRAAFPDLEHWLRERGGVDLAEQWRFRHGPRQLWLSGPFGGQEPGRGEQKAQARDIRDFEATVCGSEVRYARSGAVVGAVAFVAFVDRGRKIEQHDRDEGSVLAALQLAQAKWPTGFEVYGDQRYRTQCVWLAAEHGLRLNNAELAPALASARETLRLEREERQREASRSITPEPPPQRGPSL